MESDDVSVEIGNERDIAVITDRELVLHYTAAGFLRALCRLRAILANEVDDRAARDRSVRPPFLRLRQLLHCHPGSSGRPTCFQGSHLTASIASMRHQALFRKRLSLGLYLGHRVRTIRPDFLQSSWPPPEKPDFDQNVDSEARVPWHAPHGHAMCGRLCCPQFLIGTETKVR